MPYLKNPGGRIVAVDDPALYKHHLSQPGFSIPTPEEEKDYIQKKVIMLKDMQKAQDTVKKDNEVYLATVTPGGTDGYGVASKHLINELRMAGAAVSLIPRQQKIGVLFHNPYSILRIETAMRIIYTMFESDKIPDDWKDYLEAADLVIVPSKWCAEVFKKSGCNAEVIPLGYDSRIFKYLPRENKREARKNFTFLHYNAFNIRKGFTEVLKAFVAEFKKDEPVEMIFKTTLLQPPWPLLKSEYPNIEVITGPYEDNEMLELMRRSDCFVYPSRGEGFGIPPLEAMATGMPAIVPNAHGITEYFNKDYMYEVKVKEKCPAIYSRYKGIDTGKMVVCDIDHLRQQMRYVYEHQKEALEKGKMASEYVRSWTFEITAGKLKALFDKYQLTQLKQKPVKNILYLEEVK